MKTNNTHKRRPGLLALLSAVACVALACAFALPASALAEERVGHSVDASGKETSYSTVADALKASYTGTTVVMDADWTFEYQKNLDAPEGSKVTIDMNGHQIQSDGFAFYLRKSAQLTLKSSKKATFEYPGYSSENGSKQTYKTTTGGLVRVTDGAHSAISGEGSNQITLDGVTIAGCSTPAELSDALGSGAVTVTSGSTLNMTNGASIEHNSATRGAGVTASSFSSTVAINLDNGSSISNNYATEQGGGIQIKHGDATITLNHGSKIEKNSGNGGGGLYIWSDTFCVKSDGTGSICNNTARGSSSTSYSFTQNGGGVLISNELKDNATYTGLFENVTISDNYSAYNGGGAQVCENSVVFKDCTIKGNTCARDGGGVHVVADNDTFEDCTITGNACNLANKNYEGGGIFVPYKYDIRINGVCKIEGNTRGKDSGNADDVFLSQNVGSTALAYITGSPKQGCNVGVRTGSTGERRIARNFSYETKGALFMDLDGYYVSYGTDEGGDAWQRRLGTSKYSVTIDDQTTEHKVSSSVTVSVPAEKNGAAFWHWDTDGAVGLDPVDKYITNKYNPAFTFKMPNNAVTLKSVYVPRTKSVIVEVKAPVAGVALPATAKLTYNDGNAKGTTVTASVNWYEVSGDKKTWATGKAKANTTYVALFTAEQDTVHGVFFDSNMAGSDVTVRSSSVDVRNAASAKVNAATGALAIVSGEYKTVGASTPADTKTGTIKVKVEKKSVTENSDKAAAAAVALADDGQDDAGDENTLFEISYAYSSDNDEVTIAAPYLEGYNFLAWDGVEKNLIDDDDVVTICVSDLQKIDNTLTATYTPVVTGLTIDLDAPVAGKALDTTCGNVKATCSGDEEFDFATVLGKKDGFTVIWSPEDPDDAGIAQYSTAYTALIELNEVDGLENVEDVLADGATVTCNGVTATSAGFVMVDGKLCLAVAFPATADKAEEPGDDADKGDDKGDDSGKTDEDKKPGDTDADADADKGNADEKTDGSGTTDESGEPKADANDAQVTTQTVTTTSKAKATKKGTPSTGDATCVAAPAALLAASAVCLAVARVSRRQR